jgi:hypothetical protein
MLGLLSLAQFSSAQLSLKLVPFLHTRKHSSEKSENMKVIGAGEMCAWMSCIAPLLPRCATTHKDSNLQHEENVKNVTKEPLCDDLKVQPQGLAEQAPTVCGWH